MQLQLTACKTHCWFSVSCSFFFTIFVLCQWKNLSCQAATSSASKPLVASNFGFGQTRKFRLFQSRFLATLLEDCYWKVVLNKLLQNIILKKFCLTTNSAQNFIAKFSVSCSFFFTIFVLCQWKNLGRQAATSSARETLCAILEKKIVVKITLSKIAFSNRKLEKIIVRKVLVEKPKLNFLVFHQRFS